MSMHVDYAVTDNCKNLSESYGEICVKCGKCGRDFPQRNEQMEQQLKETLETMEITQGIASSVCPHMWYCGNQMLANGEADLFICRYHMHEHKRHDKTMMIIPYTNEELAAALKRHCKYHFEENHENCPGRSWAEPPRRLTQ